MVISKIYIFLLGMVCAGLAPSLTPAAEILNPAQTQNDDVKPYFYANDRVRIDWPKNIRHSACKVEVAAHSPLACARLLGDGWEGAVLLTLHPGYALSDRAALEKHLSQSQEALENISGIHVMQGRVLSESPLVGFLEVLRKDGALGTVSDDGTNTVRQSGFLYPYDDQLMQVFLYLPMGGPHEEEIQKKYLAFYESFKKPVFLKSQFQSEYLKKTPERVSGSLGTLGLLPGALVWGGGAALLVILFLRIGRRVRR